MPFFGGERGVVEIWEVALPAAYVKEGHRILYLNIHRFSEVS